MLQRFMACAVRADREIMSFMETKAQTDNCGCADLPDPWQEKLKVLELFSDLPDPRAKLPEQSDTSQISEHTFRCLIFVCLPLPLLSKSFCSEPAALQTSESFTNKRAVRVAWHTSDKSKCRLVGGLALGNNTKYLAARHPERQFFELLTCKLFGCSA